MAAFLCKAKSLYTKKGYPILSSLTLSIRHRSSKPQPQLLQVDMAEYDVALKLFDDLIHRILVKKATPDWLPFVPGSSFWVPPRPTPTNVVDLVHKLTTDSDHDFSDEESLFLATLRGWPSSNFFVKESASTHSGDTDAEVNISEGTEGTVKVKVLTFSENVTHSEDEEG